MKQKVNPLKAKKVFGFELVSCILIMSFFLFSNCHPGQEFIPLIDYTKSTPPKDIPSRYEDADLTALSHFAWQEFIALNWPAKSESRGLPDTSQTNGFISASQVGADTYTPVWQTYWHRNELFPDTGKTPVIPSTSDSTPPNYQYAKLYSYGGSGTGDYTLWNNLDEKNELGEDVVYAHSTTTIIDPTYQVLYEAKMNYAGSHYIYTNNLNDPTTRAKKKKKTKNTIAAQGVCDIEDNPSEYICLPCGDITSGEEGNIEIKAAWRQLNPAVDVIENFHTQKVIYYKTVKVEGVVETNYYNATMGLVGLHIIHKTKTFPNYVFATWEQKDNLSSGLVYTENVTDKFGDKKNTNHDISRTHPIPQAIKTVNSTVSTHLKNNNSVWQNYKLINVQAKPIDVSKLVGSHTNPDNSYFYLSNSVIESNKQLQTFTGSPTNPNINNVIYKQKPINMGGCMGCHGNAQKAGTDFNFLIDHAPFSAPEAITNILGCPSGAEPFAINSWKDVKKFFNLCVVETSLGNNFHGKFWDMPSKTDKQNHTYFTTMNVPHVLGGKVRICKPNHSDESMIISYLKGTDTNGLHMPQGGPYYTGAQIAELAKWIDAGCPY